MTVTTAPLIIRKVLPADAPTVVALIRSAFRGESSREGWTSEADYVADERIDVPGLLTKMAEPNGVVMAVFASGNTTDPVACFEILRYPEPSKTAYFGLFAVQPKLQNAGIGRSVLAEAERYAIDTLGATRMEMTVTWLRDSLIAWYIRRGYRVVEGETRPFPYDHLVNGKALRDDLYMIVMEKELL